MGGCFIPFGTLSQTLDFESLATARLLSQRATTSDSRLLLSITGDDGGRGHADAVNSRPTTVAC